MAELHVQKKKQSTTLWIVIGVLLLALIAWMATSRDDDPTPPQTIDRSTTGTTSNVPATTVPVGSSIFSSN